MPLVLIIVGIFLIASAIRGNTGDLFALLKGDFTGPGNFAYWLLAMLILGAVGSVEKLKPMASALMGLVVLVLILKRGDSSGMGGGFFERFTAGVSTGTAGKGTAAAPSSQGPALIVLPGVPKFPEPSVLVH